MDEKNVILNSMGRRSSDVRIRAWHGQKDALTNDKTSGQAYGGVVVMGNKFTMNDAKLIASYNQAFTAGDPQTRRNEFFKYVDQWGVVAEIEGNTAKDPKVQFRNMTTYILRKGSNTWEKVQVANNIGWAEYFYGDMGTSMSSGTRWRDKGLSGDWFGQSPSRNSAGGIMTLGTSTLKHPYPVAHYAVGNYYNVENIGKDNIDGVLVTTEARLDPSTAAGARVALQMGADFKPSNRGNAYDRMGWYPGFGLSRFEPVTTEWKRFSAINVSDAAGGIDGHRDNTISRERIMNSNIPR